MIVLPLQYLIWFAIILPAPEGNETKVILFKAVTCYLLNKKSEMYVIM